MKGKKPKRAIQVFLPGACLKRVDNWRRRQPELMTLSPAIRALVEDGMSLWDFKRPLNKISRNSDGKKAERVELSSDLDFRVMIDKWRSRYPKPPSRSAAVRILCEFGLDLDEKRKKDA